jgi:Tfp pilus assembly protein PilF
MQKRSKKSKAKTISRDESAPRLSQILKPGPPPWSAIALLALSIGAVYAPALNSPFIADDFHTIVRSKSITSIWPLIGTKDQPGPLSTPPDSAVSARPLVNLSLAINRHFGGLNPWGYHAFNVILHFFTAVLVWSVTRRTLRLPYFSGRFDASCEWLALCVALLWALHPLQSESVIYAIQRTELMMAFFYMATLYCSLRYWSDTTSPSQPGLDVNTSIHIQKHSARISWLVLAVCACLCGMASKEVMVSAPLMVLLFDRTFIAGSLAKAIRRSWPLYIGLFTTWILLIGLTIASPRPNSASFGLGPPVYIWWATQCKILLMYLKLVVWPWPLLIHYQLPYLATIADAWKYVVPVLALGIATLVLLWKNRAAGVVGTWIFAILAPTSIIPILTEMAAERRMYLPLAGLLALLVVGGYVAAESFVRRGASSRRAIATMLPLVIIITLVFALVTKKRLAAYQDPMGLWLQVLERQPENSFAHQSVGSYLSSANNNAAALDQYREAVRLNPDSTQARYGLALLLLKTGAAAEAITELREVVRRRPEDAMMRQNLASALFQSGRNSEAIEAYRAALELDPTNWNAHCNLGMAQQKAGKYQDATASYESALKLSPNTVDVYKHLADIYTLTNDREKSIAALKKGLELAHAAGDEQSAQEFSARLNLSR